MFTYTTYGLGLRSTLTFPELRAGGTSVDVRVYPGRVQNRPSEEIEPGVCFRATAQEACLIYEKAGAFLVRGGREIVFKRSMAAEERMVRHLLLGPALALLLHQRGRLVLHAGVVAIGERAVAFLGGPGSGKSTLTAALHARGHGFLVDDVAAIHFDHAGSPVVHPSFPQLKLWPEAIRFLGEAPETFPRLHPRFEKRARPVRDGFSKDPLPLERIYVLDDGPSIKIEALRPQEAFVALLQHSYLARVLKAIGGASLHFRQCGQLAASITVRRLERKRSLSDLLEMAKLVEEDLTRN